MRANAVVQRLETPAKARPKHLHTVPLAEAPMKRVYTAWSDMTADQLVEEGNRQIREKGVPSKSKLKDMISGLFRAIKRREDADRIWPRMEFCQMERPVSVIARKPKPKAEKLPQEPKSDIRTSETPLVEPPVEEIAPPTERYGSWKSKASDTIIGIANNYIQKAGIGSLKELKTADRPLWAVIRKRKIHGMLEFVEKQESREPKPEKRRESRPPKEKETPDTERMYEHIIRYCFRMGSGKAYIGHYRATLQQLRPGTEFNRQEWRAFKRCWRTMVRAGIITYNSTETAASLDIKRNHIEDPLIKRVVQQAIEDESKVKTSR